MTTITIAPEVKAELGQLKPEALTWDQYLVVLMESVDAARFERTLKALSEAQYAEAAARARERYRKARAHPRALLTPTEARKRVRALRARQ